MNLTLDQLFQMEMDQLQKEHGRVPDPNHWRWSPFDIRKWDEMLTVAIDYYRSADTHSPSPISIAEAGSGIGTKLRRAKDRGLTEFGYEFNDEYLVMARELDVACEKRDLGDPDNQPAWAAYDIVYLARPFKDDFKESAWECSVQEDMRPGAVLISTFAAVKPYQWTCLYRGTYRGVWVKPVTMPDAATMLQNVSVP